MLINCCKMETIFSSEKKMDILKNRKQKIVIHLILYSFTFPNLLTSNSLKNFFLFSSSSVQKDIVIRFSIFNFYKISNNFLQAGI